jgi:hypothetical protein
MQVPELQRHYADWEITAPEIRYVTATPEQFNPFELPAQARAAIATMLLYMR